MRANAKGKNVATSTEPKCVQQIRSGAKKAKKALGFLMGAVMKASGGAAPPTTVKQLLERKLNNDNGL